MQTLTTGIHWIIFTQPIYVVFGLDQGLEKQVGHFPLCMSLVFHRALTRGRQEELQPWKIEVLMAYHVLWLWQADDYEP